MRVPVEKGARGARTAGLQADPGEGRHLRAGLGLAGQPSSGGIGTLPQTNMMEGARSPLVDRVPFPDSGSFHVSLRECKGWGSRAPS